MKTISTVLSKHICAALLGCALTLSFAPFDVFPFAILAPFAFFFLLKETSPRQAFYLGYSLGCGLFGSGVYWVYISIYEFAHAPIAIAILLTIGFVALLSLFPACATYLVQRFFSTETSEKWIFAFPAIWVLVEWLRSLLFTGFPWLLLGYSQIHSPLKGYAPIFSVYGVSLAVLVSSGLLFVAYNEFFKRQAKASAYRYFFAMITVWITGGLLSFIPWTVTSRMPVTVSLVQGNIPQTLKWSPEHLKLSLDRYRDLTLPLLKENHIIIWPEAAIPLPLKTAADYINTIHDAAASKNASVILGIPIEANDQSGYFNAIIAIGASKQVYLKRRLVPFGEYTPLPKLTSFIMRWLDIPMSDMLPGNSWQPPIQAGPLLLQSALCYEIAFPELTRTVDPEVNAILTLTNDAWFGDSSAKAQHLQMAAMRAIELARPLFFVSNDGITAILTPEGNIQSTVKPNEATVLSDRLFLRTGSTPWMQNGIDPLLFIIFVFLYHSYKRAKITLTTKQSTGELNARTISTATN